MGYDRIRPSLDIESNLKSGIVRGGRSRRWSGCWLERELLDAHENVVSYMQLLRGAEAFCRA